MYGSSAAAGLEARQSYEGGKHNNMLQQPEFWINTLTVPAISQTRNIREDEGQPPNNDDILTEHDSEVFASARRDTGNFT